MCLWWISGISFGEISGHWPEAGAVIWGRKQNQLSFFLAAIDGHLPEVSSFWGECFLFTFDLYFLIASGVIQLRKTPRAVSLHRIHFSKNNNHWKLCEKRGHCTICLYKIRSNSHYQNKGLWLLVCRSCAVFLLPFCFVFDFEQSLSHIYTYAQIYVSF